MRTSKSKVYLAVLATIIATLASTTPAVAAYTDSILYTAWDPAQPVQRIQHTQVDANGNLWGLAYDQSTACSGSPCPVIYELVRQPNQTWDMEVIYDFTTPNLSPINPNVPLLFDATGNIYFTDGGSGANNEGAVYELSANKKGKYSLKTLYSFTGTGTDGWGPAGNLVMDAAGNLYGTTVGGGDYQDPDCAIVWGGYFGCGTVFQLSPGPKGTWTESVLHAFLFAEAMEPWGNLVLDASGNLYGFSSGGGTSTACVTGPINPGCGALFEISPQAGGPWTATTLHSFQGGADGENDYVNTAQFLKLNSKGVLFGETFHGGNSKCWCGTIFQYTPKTGGQGTYKKIYAFTQQSESDAVTIGPDDNFYGANYGTPYMYNGYIFQLTPGVKGKWTQTVLYQFGSDLADAVSPSYAPVFDAAGNMYGASTIPAGSAIYEVLP